MTALRVRFVELFLLLTIVASPRSFAQDLTGTYTSDDGGLYYVQAVGDGTFWWAGLSLDRDLPVDYVWHRGLYFTNVFRGTITGNTITGEWADVSRGTTLNSGSLTLAISTPNNVPLLTKVSSTGGFGGSTWNKTDAVDDINFNGSPVDIISRFNAVHKDQADGGSALGDDNLKAYRDQSVFYGRISNPYLGSSGGIGETLPHVGYGPGIPWLVKNQDNNDYWYYDFSQPDRDFQTFACYNALDADFDMNVNVDINRMEDYFSTTGWGNRTTGPTVYSLKFGNSAIQTKLNYGAFLHAEALMYGKAGTCDSLYDPTYGYASLLPGWGDLYSASVLVNGRPINGNLSGTNCNTFIEPCPYLVGADGTNYLVSPIGIQFGNLLLSSFGNGKLDSNGILGDGSGTYVRLTGSLVLDCGHFSKSIDDWGHTCDDDTDDPDQIASNQNQEIHPIYSIDVINSPFRPEDFDVAARPNLTGAWGGTDGSTYYVRQIGNTIWWLGMMRDRQPMQPGSNFPVIGYNQLQNAPDASCASTQCWIFANVFKGTITHATLFDIVEGDWAGVPQSTGSGSAGGHLTFYVYSGKSMSPTTTGTVFPPSIDKMYEPEDTTPPISALTVGSPQYSANALPLFVSGATGFTASGTDDSSGVQNLWYRFFAQGSTAPAYTPVIASSAMFALTGSDGLYEVDSYATDNAGNDENTHSTSVYLDNTPPVTTIVAPAPIQYGHSDSITLNYSESDGAGSGVNALSIVPTMDGQTSSQFGADLRSGQVISLESMSLSPHTFSVGAADNLGNAGSNSVTFTITVTFDSLKGDINNLTSQGCIDNLGRSLLAKFAAAQQVDGKGQVQTAINILSAALYEVEAQSGMHIATTCKDPVGRSFNPVNLLTGDIQFMQSTLAGQLQADPILGSVVSSTNVAVSGATVNLLSGKTLLAQTVTDSAGLYYFADVSNLGQGGNYVVTISLPKGFKSSTPSAQNFTWSGNMVVASFLLK